MRIESIDISKINPAEYNPRKDLQPGDKEYEKLKKSIEEFDIVEPLIWNSITGNLVGGHQRLKIIQERGDTRVYVSVVELDDAKEKALNLALNKISGEWDDVKLSELLGELSSIPDFDIELTGFDVDDTMLLSSDEFGDDFSLPDGDKAPFQQMTFTLADKQADLVKACIKNVKDDDVETYGNENSNGNALYQVCVEWEAQRI